MKAVILYATKSGAAKECAQLLAEKLCCPLYDLAQNTPDLAQFDTVVLGTGVRMGQVYQPAKKYMQQHLAQLLQKKTALFFCGAYPQTLPKTIEKNIPPQLQQSAVCQIAAGGKPPFTNPPQQDWLNVQNIDQLVTALGAVSA